MLTHWIVNIYLLTLTEFKIFDEQWNMYIYIYAFEIINNTIYIIINVYIFVFINLIIVWICMLQLIN